MKKIIPALILLFSFTTEAKNIFVPNILAPKYADTTTKSALRSKIAHDQKRLEYDEARVYVLGDLYLQRDDDGIFLEDAYCLKIYRSPKVKRGKIPKNNVLNVEHVWPQSHFTNYDRKFQKSDLHHLLPVESHANSVRGNLDFGEIEDHLNPENFPAEDCTASFIDHNTDRFEPSDKYKGDVARKKFYFSVRYKASIPPEEEEILRRWHRQDPVDKFEIEHNEMIFEIQHNRNPFIVNPGLVDTIEDF